MEVDDERRDPIDFGSQGQKVKVNLAPPPCEGMPRFALSNILTYYWTGLYYQFWPYYQILEVSIEHCNGCG